MKKRKRRKKRSKFYKIAMIHIYLFFLLCERMIFDLLFAVFVVDIFSSDVMNTHDFIYSLVYDHKMCDLNDLILNSFTRNWNIWSCLSMFR